MIKIDNESISGTLIDINKKYIISANIQERDNYYAFPRHTHRTVEIYYFIDGSCKMDIGDEVITAHTGNIIIIPPNIVHSFYLDSPEKSKFIHIHFNPNDIDLFFITENDIRVNLISIIFSIKHHYKIIADKNLNSLLYSIIDEKNDTSILSRTLCNLHLIEFIINIIKRQDINSFFLNSGDKITPRYVLLALKYIEEHYSEKILICDIANNLNISSRYLSKLFYESTNLTVAQYLTLYRINKSINLMFNTNQSLTEISLNVGLGDVQHFSRVFKNVIGINPRKYKQLLLEL
ncbi:AraC family transcriptional regulator [Clostridioides difficile]